MFLWICTSSDKIAFFLTLTLSSFTPVKEKNTGSDRVGLWQIFLQWFPGRSESECHIWNVFKCVLYTSDSLFIYFLTAKVCVVFMSFFVHQVLIDLSNTAQLDNTPRWLPLKEQSESIEHSRAHLNAQGPPGSGSNQGPPHGQGHMTGPALGPGYGMGQGPGPEQGEGGYDSPKNSVIKSRSHGIFPDPSKGEQTPHSVCRFVRLRAGWCKHHMTIVHKIPTLLIVSVWTMN